MASKLAQIKIIEFVAAVHPGMVVTDIFCKSSTKVEALPVDKGKSFLTPYIFFISRILTQLSHNPITRPFLTLDAEPGSRASQRPLGPGELGRRRAEGRRLSNLIRDANDQRNKRLAALEPILGGIHRGRMGTGSLLLIPVDL